MAPIHPGQPMKLDWSADWDSNFRPGTYLVEVTEANGGQSQKGNLWIRVSLAAIEWPGKPFLCSDFISITGGGRGLGMQKLRGLGVEEGREEIRPGELIGMRAYAVVDEEEYNNRKRLAVDIYAPTAPFAGYYPESEPPEKWNQPDPEADELDDENIPF